MNNRSSDNKDKKRINKIGIVISYVLGISIIGLVPYAVITEGWSYGVILGLIIAPILLILMTLILIKDKKGSPSNKSE